MTIFLGRRSFFDSESGNSRQKQVILDLVSSKISTKKAAEATTSDILQESNIETALNYFWGIIFTAIRAFPDALEIFVELLVTIAQYPAAVNDQGQKLTLYDAIIWEDLPMFYWEIRSEWNTFGGPLREQDLSIEDIANVWSRINHFSALLVQSELPIFQDLLSPALESIAQGLEHPIEGNYVEAINWLLPGALVWFKVAGKKIHTTYGVENQGAGPLWRGYNGFCHARWLSWKARLAGLSSDECLDENLRKDAAAVIPLMEKIEQGRKPRWTYAD